MRQRSRLVVQLYVAGLIQVAALAIALFLLTFVFATPIQQMLEREGQFVGERLCAALEDPADLKWELARARRVLSTSIVVEDDKGKQIATTEEAVRPRSQLLGTTASCLTRTGRPIVIRYQLIPPEPPRGVALAFITLVLLVVAGPAWLTARSIARPLTRLAAVARAFGDGKLLARTHLKRSDELGDLAAAFDQMADRIVGLLRTEKELLANVSHELRTPLARIRVALDLAAEGAQLEHESLQDIARDLGELERIVSDVLATARMTVIESAPNSAIPLRLEPTDVGDVLDVAAARFQALHPARPLSLSICDPSPRLEADAVLLRRVFDNLLENANTYTDDPEAEITIAVSIVGNDAIVLVKDVGRGMSESDLARAFEPFFRSDRSRSRATGGLGLGLTLSRRIVEAHRGTLRLTSELGRGTVARIELPLAAPTA